MHPSSCGSSPGPGSGPHSPAAPHRAAESRPPRRPRSRLPRALRRSSSRPRRAPHSSVPFLSASPAPLSGRPPVLPPTPRPGLGLGPPPQARPDARPRGLPRDLHGPADPDHAASPPTSRGSGPSPTAKATPAPHPRSFIVDSKLPKWRRLLPPRKPPPAPTRPLAATPAAPPPPRRPRRRHRRRRHLPALPRPRPGVWAPRSRRRAALTPLLCPLPRPPSSPPPPSLFLSLSAWRRTAAPPPHKMARARPLQPPRRRRGFLGAAAEPVP